MHRSLLFAGIVLLVECGSAHGAILRTLDFQQSSLTRPDGRPSQWENYVPDAPGNRFGTSGITLGSPGVLPSPYRQAARFEPELDHGRPRSMAKLGRESPADPGVRLTGPLDAAEGLDRFYSWHTYFPVDFTIPADAPALAPTILQAWHNDSRHSDCNPNSQMHVKRSPRNGELRVFLKVQGGRYSNQPPRDFRAEGGNKISCFTETNREVDLGPVVRGRWIHWTMHVRWSHVPSLGVTEVWRDGSGPAIPGANLYVSEAGVGESGFLEHGIYMPREQSASARSRSVWHVGMVIATTPRDVASGFDPDCRTITYRRRSVSAGRRRLAVRISARATATRSAAIRLSGRAGGLRRVSVRLGTRPLRVRGRRATLPVTGLRRLGIHRLRITIEPTTGKRRTHSVRLRSGPCAG